MGLFYFLPLFYCLTQLVHSVCHQWVVADAQICAVNALYQCSDPRGATVKRLPRGAPSPLRKRHLQLTELWSSDLRSAAAARHTRQPQRRAASQVRRRDVGVVPESTRVLLGPVSAMSDQQPPPQGAFSPTAIPKVVTDKQEAIQILRERLRETLYVRHNNSGQRFRIHLQEVESDGMVNFSCVRIYENEPLHDRTRVVTMARGHLCQMTFLDEAGNPTIAVEANLLDLPPAPASALRESTNTAVVAPQRAETMDASGDAVGVDPADHSTSAAAASEAATEPDATKKSSKYRGVSWCGLNGCWLAKASIRGSVKAVYRGPSEEEAAKAYDDAQKKQKKPAVNFPDEAPPPPANQTPLEALVESREKEVGAIADRLQPKVLSKEARQKDQKTLRNSASALAKQGSTPLGLANVADGSVARVEWNKVDPTHLAEIEENIDKVPYITVGSQEFADLGGRGSADIRKRLRKVVNDLIARRDQRDALTAKRERAAKGPYAGKGIDVIWNADDGERVDATLEKRVWLDGGGNEGVWRSMLEKEKVAKKRKRVEDDTESSLASSKGERPTKKPDFYKDTGRTKRGVARDPSVVGAPSDLPVQTHVASKFENVYGEVTTSGILYGYQFAVWNRGKEYSGLVFTTEQAAWDACKEAMENYDWPAGRMDPKRLEHVRHTYVLPPDLWREVSDNDVPDPRDVERGLRYTESDNPAFLFHGTPAGCLDSIMARGLQCRALEDVAGSGVKHSKLPEAVWAAETIDQVRRHMMSKDTYERHVSNGLTTWATWNKIAVIAFRKEGSGWKRVPMPHYLQSGCTYQPVEAFAGRAFDLAEPGNLAAMREWAASL